MTDDLPNASKPKPQGRKKKSTAKPENQAEDITDSAPEIAEAVDPLDPFSPEYLRRLSSEADDFIVDDVGPEYIVRKPGKQVFFRVHADPDFRLDTSLFFDDRSGDVYIVGPNMTQLMLRDLTPPVRLMLAVADDEQYYVIPAKIPTGTGGDRWHNSALQIYSTATQFWVRMISQRSHYKEKRAEGNLGEPEWPKATFSEILREAFGGLVIDSEDHPVYKH